MSKKKGEKKVIPLQTPANYIKTRARSLPLAKCYALSNWAEAGMSLVLVSRKHVTGNVTFGGYLVDLLCLGIKDTFYRFNEAPEELESIVENHNLQEIGYETAHNIIYGAEAFADDYGFQPQKDWAVSQYILEPDDERIPLIDIEFGSAGQPVYVAGPYDDEQMIDRVLATLDRNAGPGNYEFIGDPDLDDLSDEEEDLFGPGEMERILNGEQEATTHQQYALTLGMLLSNGNTLAPSSIDQEQLEAEAIELTGDNVFSEDDDLEILIDNFRDQYDGVLEATTPDVIDIIKKLRLENPDNPYIYFREFINYTGSGQVSAAEEIKRTARARFPDFLLFDFIAAIAAADDGRLEEAALLLKSPYINDAFPDRELFSRGEYLHFCTAWCAYFTAKKMFPEAVCYANIIVADYEDSDFINNAIVRLCQSLLELIHEKE